LFFWSEDVFRVIGNSLGVYFKDDMYFKSTGSMEMARIPIGLDLKDGLVDIISFKMGNLKFEKPLYYEGITFHHSQYHT
jgi:hypothetical protein